MKLRKAIPYLIIIGIIYTASITMAQTDPPPVMLKRPPQNKTIKPSNEQLAVKYYTQKEYEKSAILFDELYSKSPRQYYYNYLLNCYVYLKDYKEAEKLIKKHKRTKPNNFRLDVDQAYIAGLMENERKERKIIEDLTENLPANKSLIIQIASALQSKGYFEDALVVYEKARKMRENNYSFNIELATAYQYTGEYEKMFDIYLDHAHTYPTEVQMVKNKLQMIIRRDIDDNLSGILKKKMLEKAQANPDDMLYAELLLWHSMQTKDFDMAYRQARAINMRFDDQEEIMLQVADVAMSNKKYDIAEQAYGYIKEKLPESPFFMNAYSGYFTALVEQAQDNAETDLKSYKNIEKTGTKALEELGLNPVTYEISGRLAHIKAFKLNKYDEAIALLDAAIEIPSLRPVQQAWLKMELADILLFQNKVWDATLLYSQIEAAMKNEPIGHEAKYRNARLYYYVGEYTWAKTKLDILKSATSKLIANDALELSLFIKNMLEEDTLGIALNFFSKADLFAYQGNYDSAFYWLSKIENQFAGSDSYQFMIYKKAGYLQEVKKYAEADSIYNYLATYYPKSVKADNALFERALINQRYLDQPKTAMHLYMTLMKDYPESIYAGESRKKYRGLREKYGNDSDPEFEILDGLPSGAEQIENKIN